MINFVALEKGERIYVMKDNFHLQVGSVSKIYEDQPTTAGDSGIMVKVDMAGFLNTKEIVLRSDILSETEYEDFRRSRTIKSAGEAAFDSAFKTSADVINAAGEFAGKLKGSFDKFKGEVLTDELMERMRKEAESTFNPKVAKEKIDTCSEVLGSAVQNLHDKFFKDGKGN